jgi:hypothetical protein
MSHMPTTPPVIPPGTITYVVNVRDYGARGDGTSDDTAAINLAITASGAVAGDDVLGGAVYFPPGQYVISSTLTPPSYTTFKGDSRYTTTLYFTGTSRAFEFVSKYGCGFQDVTLQLPLVSSPSTVTGFYLSNCFRFTFHRVIINGHHTVSTPDPQSSGIELRDNTGDSRFIDCDINNLGAGIRTSSIQNYVSGCVFSTNKYSVYGDAGTFSAGLVMHACTFTGTGATGGTDTHVIVDRDANMWKLIGCWLEGCRKGVQIGASGVGGPTEFGIIGCKIAAVDTCIDVQNGTLPHLENITLGIDATGTPTGSYTDVSINATGAPSGTAIGVRAGTGFDLDPSVFPPAWTLIRRGAMRLPSQVDVTDTVTLTGDSGLIFDMSTADVCPAIFKKGSGSSANLAEWYRGGTRYAYIDSFGVFSIIGGIIAANYVQVGASGSTRWYQGTGTPEGVVTATVGSLFSRTDGGATTTLYVKTSGTGNTGWTAK